MCARPPITACIAIANRYHLDVTAVSPNPSLRGAELSSPAATPPSGPALPCLNSQQLFGRDREILIQHGGSYYRLRITHSNKLILTK